MGNKSSNAGLGFRVYFFPLFWMPVFSVTRKPCLPVRSSLMLAMRVKTIPLGLAVSLFSNPPTWRRKKELARCLPPNSLCSGEVYLSGVNDTVCLSQVQAAACCHLDNKKVNTSLSSKLNRVSSNHGYSGVHRKKGQRPARITLRGVRFRVVFATLDVHGRQDVRLLPGLKQRTQHRWEALAPRPKLTSTSPCRGQAPSLTLTAGRGGTLWLLRPPPSTPPSAQLLHPISSLSLGQEKQEGGCGEAGSR